MSRRKVKSGRKKTLKIETKRKTRAIAENDSRELEKLCSNKTTNNEKLNDVASRSICSKNQSNNEKFVDDKEKVFCSKQNINDEKFVEDKSKIRCSKNNINNEKFVEDETDLLRSKKKNNNEDLVDDTSNAQKYVITPRLRRLRQRNDRIDAATNQCEICYLEFSNKFNLRRHLEDFLNPQYPCDECGTKFSNKKQLRIHVIYTHENIERRKINLNCPVCNQIFKLEAQLQAHLYHYHDGGLVTVCNKSSSKTKRSRKTKKSSVDHENRLKNCTKTLNQLIGLKNLESLSVTQSFEKSSTPEKINEMKISTTGEKEQPLEMINTLKDKFTERLIEISQATEEIEKTENNAGVIDTPKNCALRSDLRENTEKHDEPLQKMLENPCEEINSAITENLGMVENLQSKKDEISRNDEEQQIAKLENRKLGSAENIRMKLHNLDNGMSKVFAILNDASEGIKTPLPDTSEMRDKKANEASQNIEECETTDDNGVFNGTSANFPGKNEEKGKSVDILQNFKESEKTDNNGASNERSDNLHEKQTEKETLLEIFPNCQQSEKTDNTRPIDNTNIHEKTDEEGKSLKVDKNFQDTGESDNPVFHDTSVNSSGKNRSLEIFQSFAEIAKTDETPIVKDTSFNVLEKNIEVEKTLEISKNYEENIYRRINSDLETDDSIDGSESDQSEFAEALDDIFRETFENHSKKHFDEETECTSMINTDPQNDEGTLPKSGNSVTDKTKTTFSTAEAIYKIDSLFAKMNIIVPKVKDKTVKLPDISQNDKESEKINDTSVMNDFAKIGDPADSSESDQGMMAEASVEISQEMYEHTFCTNSNTFLYEKMELAKTQSAETFGNARNTRDKTDNCINNKSDQPFTMISTLPDEVDVLSFERSINIPEENYEIDISEEISQNGQKIDEINDPPILDFTDTVEKKNENNRLEILQIPDKIENNKMSVLISDDTESYSSSHPFDLQRNDFEFNVFFQKTLESETTNYLNKNNEFERDNALRAQYACKHCYVSVTRINVDYLQILESTRLPSEVIEKSSHRIYSCSLCPEIFPSKTLRQKHIDDTHTIIPSVICDKIFTEKSAMCRHYRLCHSIGRDNLETCICGLNMHNRQDLDDHFFLYCGNTRLVKQRPPISHKCEPLPKTHICDNCGKDFWVKSCLYVHLLHCINTEPVVTSNSGPMKKIIRRKFGQGPIHPNERICRICWVEFTDSKKLLLHEEIYAGPEIHRCIVCGTIFRDKRLLNAHSSSAHNLRSRAKYTFYCGICNQGFFKNIYRRVHMMHIHGDGSSSETIDESPNVATLQTDVNKREQINEVFGDKCKVCNQVFVVRKRFIEHTIYYKFDEVIHCKICNVDFQGQYSAHRHNKMTHYSAEMRTAYPYMCKICDERFLYRTHLRAHQLHVHGETSKNEIVLVDANSDIEIRSVSRTSGNSLPSQNRTARVHTCAICEMSFSSVDLLVAHQMEYQNDGDFVCTSCEKKFRTASLLLDHLCLNHSSTIDGSVKCRRCDENFLTPSAWVSHVKHFHTIDAREPPEFYVETNALSDNDFGTKDVQLIPTNCEISGGATYKRMEDKIDGISLANAVTSSVDAGGEMEKMSDHCRIDESEKIVDEKRRMCNVCSKNCRNAAQLARHMAIWSDEGPYMCEICGRRFMCMRLHLKHKKKHFRWEARDDSRFCVSCDEGFDTIKLFAIHKAHIHRKKSATGQSGTLGAHSALESEGNRQIFLPSEQLNERTRTAPFCSLSASRINNKMEASSRPQEKTIVNNVTNSELNKKIATVPSGAIAAIFGHKKMSVLPPPHGGLGVNKGINGELNASTATTPSRNGPLILRNNKRTGLPRPHGATIVKEITNHELNALMAPTPSRDGPYILRNNNRTALPRPHGATIVKEITNHELNASTAMTPSRAGPLILANNKMTLPPRPCEEQNVKKKPPNHGMKNWNVNRRKNHLPVNYKYHDLAAMGDSSIVHSLVEVRNVDLKRKTIDTITINDESPINTPDNFSSKKQITIANTSGTSINEAKGTRNKQIPTISKQCHVVNTTNPRMIGPNGSWRIIGVKKMSDVINASRPRRLPFKCEFCDFSFISEDSRSQHIKSIHTVISVPPIVDISDDSNCAKKKNAVQFIVGNQAKKISSNRAVPSELDESIATLVPLNLEKLQSPKKVFLTVLKKSGSGVTLHKQSSEITRCEICNTVFLNANLLRLHQACVHDATDPKIRHDNDLMMVPSIEPSATEPKGPLEELRSLVNFLPISLNSPNKEIIIEQNQSNFSFEPVMIPISPDQFHKVENEPVKIVEETSIVQSSSGSNATGTASQCQVSDVGKSTSNPTFGALKVRSFAGIMKNLRRNNVRKRINVSESIIEPAEKRYKGSVYDPIAFEELCRQHNLKPRSTSRKNEIPLVTLL